MTHRTVHEWGRVPVGDGGFSRPEADALLAAARRHPEGGDEGTRILTDHHRHLTARQIVGVLAGPGCSLEILPKVDRHADAGDSKTVRDRLVHMLDVALDLELVAGQTTAMAKQDETLLDVLIRLFADHLLTEIRRGLPRQYSAHAEDLPTLRGRLDVIRQLTTHAVRPDKLASRFDQLDSNMPLTRIMKACVVFLSRQARHLETQRKLAEARHALSEIPITPVGTLPWAQVRIDRTNRRWHRLYQMAALFLRREWQATHHDAKASDGVSLLFPMNDLFEAYVAAQLRRALADTWMRVVLQGGRRFCLGDWQDGGRCKASVFQTRPDIILQDRNHRTLAIIDTKWKSLSTDPLDRKHGVSQQDVYQLMAYARLYDCANLVMLYPSTPEQLHGIRHTFGIGGGMERLTIATVDLAGHTGTIAQLRAVMTTLLPSELTQTSSEHINLV